VNVYNEVLLLSSQAGNNTLRCKLYNNNNNNDNKHNNNTNIRE